MQAFARRQNRLEQQKIVGDVRADQSAPQRAHPVPDQRPTADHLLTHRRLPSATLTMRTLSEPGDGYEREADDVAERVMRMPDPDLQHRCPCGGGCPRCQADQPRQTFGHLQRKHSQGGASGGIVTLPIVHDVLGSAGHSLDPSTRVFMEQRFGSDFSNVQIHSDDRAAQSARSLDALAYTVAPHIVFGPGQYAPHTTEGRTLLAHELAHILQPDAGAVIRRKPAAKAIKAQKRDAWLKELAEQPDHAHYYWKHLTNFERIAVVIQMGNRYGFDFAKSFLQLVGHVQLVFSVFGSNDPHAQKWFQARGYRLWERTLGSTPSSSGEFWVHPSGKVILQLFDRQTIDCTAAAERILSRVLAVNSEADSADEDRYNQKRELDHMDDTTTGDYLDRYNDYISSLHDTAKRLEDEAIDFKAQRDQIEEAGCPFSSPLDDQIRRLNTARKWAGFVLTNLLPREPIP